MSVTVDDTQAPHIVPSSNPNGDKKNEKENTYYRKNCNFSKIMFPKVDQKLGFA